MRISIEYSPKFRRLYKKLPGGVKDLIEEKESIFRKYPFDKRLGTHKLSGPLRGYLAFRVDRSYRVVFSFAGRNVIRLHSVGDHSIYKRK